MTNDISTTQIESSLGEVTVAEQSLRVVFQRHYAKPVEAVWTAIATPEGLARWLAEAEIDLKTGGTIRLVWNGGTFSMQGRITVCEPPRTLAWTWLLGERETEVRFDLRRDGDGCSLTLTHSGLSPFAGHGAGVRAGWHAHLEGVPEAIEGRSTPWATKIAREETIAHHYPELPES